MRRGSLGIGLGLAAIFYFLNLIANISEQAEFLKYITPFSYADSAGILSEAALELSYIIPGMIYAFSSRRGGVFEIRFVADYVEL